MLCVLLRNSNSFDHFHAAINTHIFKINLCLFFFFIKMYEDCTCPRSCRMHCGRYFTFLWDFSRRKRPKRKSMYDIVRFEKYTTEGSFFKGFSQTTHIARKFCGNTEVYENLINLLIKKEIVKVSVNKNCRVSRYASALYQVALLENTKIYPI